MSLDISFWYVRELTKSDGLSLNIEEELYTDNITHNLSGMAEAVKVKDKEYDTNLYSLLWKPIEDLGIVYADEMLELLQQGYKEIRKYPREFSLYNASNGWGTYPDFLSFVRRILDFLLTCEYDLSLVEIRTNR